MSDKTDQTLDDLTDEERALLAGDETESAVETTETTEEAEKPEVEAVATEEAAPEDMRQEILPPLDAQAPEDIDARLAALDKQAEELDAKFDDGEITTKELREELRKISDQREAEIWKKREAELSEKMLRKAELNAWQRETETFMMTKGRAIVEKGEPAMLAFDRYVRGVTGDPANQNLSDRAQLEKAHKLFLKDFGPAFGGQAPETKTAETGRKERVVPPTLARLPAAEVETTDDGRFAALDRLERTDPIAYEEAVGRLSASDRAAYGL